MHILLTQSVKSKPKGPAYLKLTSAELLSWAHPHGNGCQAFSAAGCVSLYLLANNNKIISGCGWFRDKEKKTTSPPLINDAQFSSWLFKRLLVGASGCGAHPCPPNQRRVQWEVAHVLQQFMLTSETKLVLLLGSYSLIVLHFFVWVVGDYSTNITRVGVFIRDETTDSSFPLSHS